MFGLTPADALALGWFALLVGGYSYATRYGALARRGLVAAISAQRYAWMKGMADRNNRMVDIQVLNNLSRGNGFFASTSVLVTGAFAALFGAYDIQALLDRIPLLHASTPFVWQLKVLFEMSIFVFAFFKFAWAFRLSHYTAIMVGATPNPTHSNARRRHAHAAETAKLACLVGEHSNIGLRAYYFGLAGLGWFIHPAVFMLTTALVVLVLYRREYHSRALAAIKGSLGARRRGGK
ncbi:MAG: DUF599 family protein [Pseudomonadota bacterium]|nr:DUF599 family protein [Pseudomonadota bacterium]